jgi:hypothetical protein
VRVSVDDPVRKVIIKERKKGKERSGPVIQRWLNHISNNEYWINARRELCETYSTAGKFLEEVLPEEGTPR